MKQSDIPARSKVKSEKYDKKNKQAIFSINCFSSGNF